MKGGLEKGLLELRLNFTVCALVPFEGDIVQQTKNIQNNTQQQQQTRKEGIKDIILGKKYRLTTLILSLIWFTCGFLGYGVRSYNIGYIHL